MIWLADHKDWEEAYPHLLEYPDSTELRSIINVPTYVTGAILEMMSQQMTNMQIAKELGYSESTIRHETMPIYELLQAIGRREAVVLARKLSLIK